MLPLAVRGNKLQGITYDLPVASAVKISFTLAGLLADSPTTLTEPSNSRDHTERMLRYFEYSSKDNHTITIVRNKILKHEISSCQVIFHPQLFVGALITPDSELIIRNVGVNPTRTGLLHVLQQMGAKISLFNKRMICGEPVADIHIVHSKLKGATVEGQIVPTLIDEIPALVIAALHADGETIIRDATELRVKETDRIAALVSELNKIGGLITELPDGLIIHGSQQLAGGSCESWHDHRIAMALAIAGLNVKDKISIKNSDCVAISYPNFSKI